MFVDDFFDSNPTEGSDDCFDCCFRQNQMTPAMPNYFYGGMQQPMPVYPCGGTNAPLYGQMHQPVMPMQPAAGAAHTPQSAVSPSGTGTQVPLQTLPSQNFVMAPGSPVIQDVNYTQGYLRTQIGKKVRVEFLIGTTCMTDRIGTLMEVGISYVILQPIETDDKMLCDIYSIKFVTIYG